MVWTYSGDPASSELDQLRFTVGDVDETRQLWQNAELTYIIGITESSEEAARRLLQSKIRQLALTPRVRLGSFTYDASSLISSLKDNLEALGITRGAMAPWAGGISKLQKEGQETREDRVTPRFRRGQFDNPRSSRDS